MFGRWVGCVVLVLLLGAFGCNGTNEGPQDAGSLPENGVAPDGSSEAIVADVIKVSATGSPGDYTFSVQIKSPDLGCQQYADWWEVLDESGKLLYRRILLHSHVGEQPFERTGGSVPIQADQVVWVRAHMNEGGYGGKAFKGSVKDGFQDTPLDASFAASAATTQPLPESCAY